MRQAMVCPEGVQMAVHVFLVDENNFQICVQRGLVALPEPSEEKQRKENTVDGLLSRLFSVREDDYILMYVVGTKELRGLWQADGRPFYDRTPVWQNQCYPFRCKIKCSQYNFENPLKLNDVIDLQNTGKIWSWALRRATGQGTNVMFSVSDEEFRILLNEFFKINPFSMRKSRILEPYPFHEQNQMEYIHLENGEPHYEYSVMALLNRAFANGEYTDIFGNYTDCLSYVPTSLGREMDILLMFQNPVMQDVTASYDIIEVKKSKFDAKALKQLIDYEAWFLQHKVSRDLNMVRTTAVASSFSDEVKQYVKQREYFENKPIKLLRYEYLAERKQLVLKNAL